MNNKHDELIKSLSDDLTPNSLFDSDFVAIVWFFIAISCTCIVMYLMQPFRSNIQSQLLSSPRFLIESFLGFSACLLLSICALRSAVPARLSNRFLLLTGAISFLWLSNYALNLLEPSLEPSMAGKRLHCYFEALLYSLPSSLIGGWLIIKRLPLHNVQSALLLGFSASMLPALIMQFTCMYEARHILSHHIVPGFISALVIAGAFLLIRRLKPA